MQQTNTKAASQILIQIYLGIEEYRKKFEDK